MLDLANLYVTRPTAAEPGGAAGPDTDTSTHTDAAALMASLPADRIAYVHVAGGTVQGGRYHDTHTHPLWPEAVTLVEELWARTEPPGLLLERETRATGDDLDAELTALEAAIARGRARRSSKAASGATTTAARSPAHPPARSLRRAVGASQAQLLRSLSGRSAPPPGFARADIDAIADVLAHKRADAVRQAVPELAVTQSVPPGLPGLGRSPPPRRRRPGPRRPTLLPLAPPGRPHRRSGRRDRRHRPPTGPVADPGCVLPHRRQDRRRRPDRPLADHPPPSRLRTVQPAPGSADQRRSTSASNRACWAAAFDRRNRANSPAASEPNGPVGTTSICHV